MLLYILNLPHDVRIGRLRSLITEICGIDDIILDNLKNHADGKRITVGLNDEVQASVVMAKINGYFLDGKKLQVEMVSKNKSSWQCPKMPYYAPPTAAPIPYTNSPNMFQPPMGQDLNTSSNLPYYLTQTQTSYDYGNPSAVPPVTYPAPVPTSAPIWNQMAGFQNQPQPVAYAGQSYTNQPMFAPSSQERSNPQKRDSGACNSSGYDSPSISKRPRFVDQNASNTVPRSNGGKETRDYDSNRSYNDRSWHSIDDRDRYDSRDQHYDRERRSDRDSNRDRSRFDSREQYDSYDSDRRDHESRSRGHYDNSERGHNSTRNSGGYGSDRNDYSKRHDSSFGSEYTREDNAPRFEPTRTYSNASSNSKFTKPPQFGNRTYFAPNKDLSGRKNTFNSNKLGKGGSIKSDVEAKKFDQPHSDGHFKSNPDKILSNKARDQLLKALLFPAMQKTTQIIINNCKNPTLNPDMFKKLRELVKVRIRDIVKKLTQGQNVTNANQLYNLYRAQYPATEDPDFLATIRNKVLPPTNQAANISSDQQDTQEPTNSPNDPLKLNPAPPTEKLPKHPNSDKRIFKEMKKQGKEMGKDDYVHPVDPQYVPAIAEEIEALRNVFIEACEPSPDEQIEKVRREIVTVGVEQFLKFMKLHISKRLSDDFNACVRVHFYYKTPPRPELDIFLKQYDVISLKKSDKHKYFIATCNKADGYDRLLALERTEIGGETITLKPMHLVGAPTKTAETKKKGNLKSKSINNNARNSQAKFPIKNQPVANKLPQKKENVDQDLKNSQIIDQESKNTQSIDEKPRTTQNIDIKSENTQGAEEKSKGTINMTKEENMIDNTIISSLDADDLEDF